MRCHYECLTQSSAPVSGGLIPGGMCGREDLVDAPEDHPVLHCGRRISRNRSCTGPAQGDQLQPALQLLAAGEWWVSDPRTPSSDPSSPDSSPNACSVQRTVWGSEICILPDAQRAGADGLSETVRSARGEPDPLGIYFLEPDSSSSQRFCVTGCAGPLSTVRHKEESVSFREGVKSRCRLVLICQWRRAESGTQSLRIQKANRQPGGYTNELSASPVHQLGCGRLTCARQVVRRSGEIPCK